MKRNMKVGDLMSTAMVTVRESDALERAELAMRFAGIRHLPVIDEKYHVVGVLSDRDVLRWLATPGDERLRVGRIMTRKLHTVGPETPARQAIETMLEQKIGCLPVVGDEQQLVGIITETDFLHVAHQAIGTLARRADD